MFNSLSEALAQLNHYNRTRYVVLWDFQNLPMRTSDIDPIEVLVSDKAAFCDCLGLQKVKGKTFQFCNREGKKLAEFLVHEKGHNFLPERFESELLSRAWNNANDVSVPDQEHAILLILWRNLHIYRNVESTYEKWILGEYLTQRVGTKFAERN